MDEPTAALTETEIESLFRVTRLLKEQGTGIVYISHRLEELALIADRATVMRDGQYISTVDYECGKNQRSDCHDGWSRFREYLSPPRGLAAADSGSGGKRTDAQRRPERY